MFSRRIAFLGLGAMGFPMVNRLCDAGYTLQTAPYLDDPQYDDCLLYTSPSPRDS